MVMSVISPSVEMNQFLEGSRVSKKAALTDYELLLKESGRGGLRLLDKFFIRYRLATKTRHGISFIEIAKDTEKWEALRQKAAQIKKTPVDDVTTMQMYHTFQLYYGSVNQFKPAVARQIYKTLGARVGILDFTAGWGGRCLAAMSLGIPYIGIDSNTRLQKPYREMEDFFGKWLSTKGSKPKVEMVFRPAETVDFSKFAGRYDLIFTSPPYVMLERYQRMPDYEDRKAFMTKFFIPTVREAWTHLLPGGHMAINMPEHMFNTLVEEVVLPKAYTIPMPLATKHPTAAKMQTSLKNDERVEHVYVWRKV
jgi:hypothetical protein